VQQEAAMVASKVVVYCITLASALFFAFWELKLKRRLTEEAFRPSDRAGDFGILNDLPEKMKREQILRDQPRQALFKFRMVVILKFLFVAILIVEVIVLQRPT
jgi:hypothetical protein